MAKKLAFILTSVLLITTCCVGNTDKNAKLISYIESQAKPFVNSKGLNDLINDASGSKLVLLGEASHGTHEYYTWRDSISRRLIAEQGFRFIAVEGDWASLYELNRYVKNMPGAHNSAKEVLRKLDRWPLWMWGNHEIVGLAEWLRTHNDKLNDSEKVGFYGMDVYDEWKSKEVLLRFLKKHSPDVFEKVKENYNCILPYKPDSWLYARAVAAGNPDCVTELKKTVTIITDSKDRLDVSEEEFFYILQNALVVKHAEKFYRKSVGTRDASSWNSRARYMHMTVGRLLQYYGDNSKGIVWAHNTHIGDARFTDMFNYRQENIGQLSRINHGPENVFLIGFGTYKGKVKAGSQWGSRMQTMNIPPAAANSHEDILSKVSHNQFYLLFDDDSRRNEAFVEPRGNRAVGVVYNPRVDHQQNYVNTILPLRYDAFIFFRETKALNPLKR